PPAGYIHLVNALVAEVAVAGVPEPVPVVVITIAGELMDGRGTVPEVVIEPGGHRLDRLAADGVAPLETETAREIHVADQAVAHLLDSFLDGLRGADLAALLAHLVVLAGGGDDLLRLEHVVRARLLHVNVFAGLHAPNRHQGMPVVRGG